MIAAVRSSLRSQNAILGAIVAAACVITLHAIAVIPVAYQTVAVADVQPFQGFAYVATIPAPYPGSFEPDIRVHENGTPLPYPHLGAWGTVVSMGEGRFHTQPGKLYFSAPDNSDPRSNGRRYEVTMPVPLSRWLVRSVLVVGAAAVVVLILRNRRELWRFFSGPPFWVSAAILAACVIANRAWYFIDFPILAIHPDSGSYYAAAELIGTATWPNFGNRPPVYPIFLRAVFALWDRAMAVAVAQTALSFAAALLMVYGCYRWRRWLGVPAALTLALFLWGFTTLEHDTAMLSESLYSSLLLLAFAALLIGLRGRGAGWLGLSSTSMALAILTRPAGMFLIVVYMIAGAWLMWRRFGRAATVAFLIPLPALLIAMSLYNMRVVRVFAPTTWGEANLAVATFLGWQTDPSYPPAINADIERIQGILQARLRGLKGDATLLDRSWNPMRLGGIFVEGFNQDALNIAIKMGGTYETDARQWIRRISFDAIRKRPDQYAKFVFTMLFQYFRPIPEYDFRAYLQNRASVFYIVRLFSAEKDNAFMVRLGKEHADQSPPPAVVITNPDPAVAMDQNDRIVLTPTRAWRIYDVTHRIRRGVFQRVIWPAAVPIGLLASIVVLARTRLRHDGAFAVFVITISAIGASLVVSLVEFSQPRYSYPMEWTYGVSLVLLPLLFVKGEET
jgi:hypothetical protein